MLTQLVGNNIEAKILLDSICVETGKRITTFELTYPRFVHAELMTHRLFSRNSASSRAIPVKRMIQNVMEKPALPVFWGKNEAGMQASEELTPHEKEVAMKEWFDHRDQTIKVVERLIDKVCTDCMGQGEVIEGDADYITCERCKGSGLGLNLHKQLANRLLEPWMRITVIVTATEFSNWFSLRSDPHAQPEIKYLSDLMQRLYYTHVPTKLQVGHWHIPMLRMEDHPNFMVKYGEPQTEEWLKTIKKIATARIARISYLNHDGNKTTVDDDIKRHDSLSAAGHWSCFEHIAQALPTLEWSGNFCGWKQYRKEFPNEHRTNFKPNLPDLEELC